MQTIRDFVPADRYIFDRGPCSYANGFAQIDTGQDASYFGTWCSPERRTMVNYCEGDLTTIICDSDEEFVTLLRENAEWTEANGHGPFRIDPGLDPSMKEVFDCLGLSDLLHGSAPGASL